MFNKEVETLNRATWPNQFERKEKEPYIKRSLREKIEEPEVEPV